MGERGLSLRTMEAYASDLRIFSTFCQSQKRFAHWSEVDSKAVMAYMEWERDRGRKPGSLARRMASLKGFFRFLVEERTLSHNPCEHLDRPRVRRPLPHPLENSEILALLESPEAESPEGLRDRAFLEILYAAGLRVSEACSLKMGDAHFDQGYIKVMGKGKKERIIPIHQRAIQALKRYIDNGRSFFLKRGNLPQIFVGKQGFPLSRKTFYARLRRYALQVGLDRLPSPHDLRHSFASHLLEGGANLRSVQELLGHSDIATTQIYTFIPDSRLRSVHHEFHPRSRTRCEGRIEKETDRK